jgi:hypothetical protein
MKAIIIDGKIKIYSELPKVWGSYMNFQQASVEIQEQEGFYELVIPIYNDKTHKLGEVYWDDINKIFTYPLISKTLLEIQQEKEAELDNIDNSYIPNIVIKRLLQALVLTILTKTTVTTRDINDISVLYSQYRLGKTYIKLDRFNHSGMFYEVTNNFTATEVIDPKNVVDMYVKYVK